MMQTQARRNNQQQRVNRLSGVYTNTSLIMTVSSFHLLTLCAEKFAGRRFDHFFHFNYKSV